MLKIHDRWMNWIKLLSSPPPKKGEKQFAYSIKKPTYLPLPTESTHPTLIADSRTVPIWSWEKNTPFSRTETHPSRAGFRGPNGLVWMLSNLSCMLHWQYMLIDLFISKNKKIFSSFEPTLVDVTSTNFGLQQRFCRVQGVRAVLSAWKRPNENGEGFSDIVDKPPIIYL